MSEYTEFDPLLSKYLDGSIRSEELVQLETKLLGDSEFAAHFSRWCLLHRQVTELLTENTLHQLMDQFSQGAPSLPIAALSQLTSGAPPSAPLGSFSIQNRSRRGTWRSTHTNWEASLFNRFWVPGIATAALLLISFGLYYQFRSAPSGLTGEDINTIRRQSSENLDVVATLTQVVDGVWAKKAPTLETGQLLAKEAVWRLSRAWPR